MLARTSGLAEAAHPGSVRGAGVSSAGRFARLTASRLAPQAFGFVGSGHRSERSSRTERGDPRRLLPVVARVGCERRASHATVVFLKRLGRRSTRLPRGHRRTVRPGDAEPTTRSGTSVVEARFLVVTDRPNATIDFGCSSEPAGRVSRGQSELSCRVKPWVTSLSGCRCRTHFPCGDPFVVTNRSGDWQSRPSRSCDGDHRERGFDWVGESANSRVLPVAAVRIVLCQPVNAGGTDDANRTAEAPGDRHPAEPAGGTASLPARIAFAFASRTTPAVTGPVRVPDCGALGIAPGQVVRRIGESTPNPRPMRSAGAASFTPVTVTVFSTRVFRVCHRTPPTDSLGWLLSHERRTRG